MAKPYKTPGVYIQEQNAFPGSIVAVETAVPVFIGYTAIASRKGKSLIHTPVRISSFKEYTDLFGGEGLQATFTVAKTGQGNWDVNFKDGIRALLYESIRLFYANGGGSCYIVSVGTYGLSTGKDENGRVITTEQKLKLSDKDLIKGIEPLLKELEPTLVVIPDALLLDADACYKVYRAAINHCNDMQNRMAILDIHNGYMEPKKPNEQVNIFRDSIGSEHLEFASAYYPWLDTSLYSNKEVNWTKVEGGIDVLKTFCMEDLAQQFIDKAPHISEQFTNEDFHDGLYAVSPTYRDILDEIRIIMNRLPVAPAMAGIYNVVDNQQGVWMAPANIGLNSVVKPTVNITHEEQEELNVDALTWKSINAIRTFPRLGTLVWGARTLNGNSLDWRYINVRRTMIMLEQSIKLAARAFVFEPNVKNTWVSIESMIENFLDNLWKQGALVGSTPAEAFSVSVGLGATMTANDILEGRMNITVKVAFSHPAEFIVITFMQQQQKS